MPAQRKLTVAEYLAATDLYAKGIQYLYAAAGTEDTVGTAAYEARLVRDMIGAFALSDEYQLQVDLLEPSGTVVTAIVAESASRDRFSQFNGAVTRHLGSDLNAWLLAAGARVHNLWRRGGNASINPANVFPPVTVLGTVAVTGSGAGTFTAGTAVDQTMYAGAQVAVKVLNQPIGAANVGVSVTGLDDTGATRTWTGTIPNGSVAGTVVNLAGTGVTRGVSASACALTLGTTGDDFEIVTVEDRTI